MKDNHFTVFAVDGDFRNFEELETNYMRYDNLSWEETITLCLLSFRQGYQVVVIPADGSEAE